jgi:polyisoprenoid-binding protein YceI
LKRRFYAVLLATVFAGVLAACSGGSTAADAATTAIDVATAAPVATEAAAQPATQAPTDTPVATVTPVTQTTFVIDPAQSAAHFIIHEVLAGQPNTVDGVTNKAEGQILASYDAPSTTSVSPVRVDMSDLTTDNPMRTRTLQATILQTNNPAFQFAEFTTTKLDGLPATITIGQAFDFTITGNLAMHGVSKEATFDATVTPVSETQLSGKASLTVHYTDWEIKILRLPPQVASVEDTAILEIDFVANAR